MINLIDIFEQSKINFNENDNEFDLFEGGTSVVKRGLATKRAALAGGSAMALAKIRNPSLFKLYTKHNLIRKQLKKKIMKQYGAMARQIARQKIK